MDDSMTLQKLKVIFEAETKEFRQEVSRIKSEMGSITEAARHEQSKIRNVFADTQNQAKSVMSGMKRMIAAGFATTAAVNFTKECITLASDLIEVQNVVDVTFGAMTEKVNEFADTSIEKFGLSETSAKRYASTLGAMLKSSGLSTDTSLEMSLSMTGLTADMSSFYNIRTNTMFDKIRSGLAGEIEPLRQLGINMSVANLEAFALSQGIETAYDKMSQGEQQILRYNYLISVTKDAQGDFARTSGTMANQMRLLNENWNRLCVTIGQVFMPIANNILPYINGLVMAFQRLTQSIGTLLGVDFDFSSSNSGISDSFESVGDNATTAGNAVKALNKSLAKFDELNNMSSGNTKGSQGGSTGGAGTGIKPDTSYFDKINTGMDGMKNKAEEIADILEVKIGEFLEALDKIKPALAGLAAAFATYKVLQLFGGLKSAIAAFNLSPAGMIMLAIAAFVGLAVGLGTLYDDVQKKKIAKMFGNISLSIDEIKDAARSLVGSEYLDQLDEAMMQLEKLKTIEETLDGYKNTIKKITWKVGVGIELTEEDKESYKTAVDGYAAGVMEYAEQSHYAANCSIDVIFTDAKENAKVKKTFDEFYNGIYGELDSLGTKLEKTVTVAWEDGLLDIDEAKEIAEITQQMENIQQMLSEGKLNADLGMLEMKFSGADLTKESYDQLIEESEELVKTTRKDIYENAKSLLAKYEAMKLQLKADYDVGEMTKGQYDNEMRKVENDINVLNENTQLRIKELDVRVDEFKTNTVKDLFNSEFDKTLTQLSEDAGDNYGSYFYSMLDILAIDFSRTFATLDKTLQGEMKKSVEAMKPKEAELEAVLNEYLDAGKAVPEHIIKGLQDIYMEQAMVGEAGAVIKLLSVSSNQETVDKVYESYKKMGIEMPSVLSDGYIGSLETTKKNMSTATTVAGTAIATTFKNTFLDAKTKKELNTAMDGYLNTVNTAINNFKPNSIKIAIQANKKAFDDTIEELKVKSGNLGLSSNIMGFASGGYPAEGQLFLAKEPGNPELVGNVGGRTAVMNNNQIVEAVSSGVADAVYRSMIRANGSNNSATLRVEGDPTGMFKIIKSEADRYRKQTGYSPF